VLEHHPDPAVLWWDPHPMLGVDHDLVVDDDRTLVRSGDSGDHRQRETLAGSGGADQHAEPRAGGQLDRQRKGAHPLRHRHGKGHEPALSKRRTRRRMAMATDSNTAASVPARS
jgi:hypothetical protein